MTRRALLRLKQLSQTTDSSSPAHPFDISTQNPEHHPKLFVDAKSWAPISTPEFPPQSKIHNINNNYAGNHVQLVHKHNENAKFTNAIFIEMHEMQACDQKLKILNTNIAYCRTLEQTAFKITLSTKFFWNYIHSKYPHKPNDLNKLRWALSVPRHPKRIVPGNWKCAATDTLLVLCHWNKKCT